MKAPDLVTVVLIGLAVYLLVSTWRNQARAPRTFYAQAELRDWWM